MCACRVARLKLGWATMMLHDSSTDGLHMKPSWFQTKICVAGCPNQMTAANLYKQFVHLEAICGIITRSKEAEHVHGRTPLKHKVLTDSLAG